jgi:hypothetical protein
MHQMSVFEPQQIGGKWVNPLCLPQGDDTIARSVAGALNLLWFSLNIAAHRKDSKECDRLALMCKAILTIEHQGINIKDENDLQDAIDSIDEVVDSQEDDYKDDDEDDTKGD